MAPTNFNTFRRIRPIIVVTAELTGVLTLVGTLGSVLFNSIRFRAWGLNFLEIATPGDILMSGLEVAATAWTFFLVAVALAIVTIIPVLLFRFVRVSNRVRRIILFLGFLGCVGALCIGLSLDSLPLALSLAVTGGVLAYFALHFDKLDERPHLNLPLVALFCGAMVFQLSDTVEHRAFSRRDTDGIAVGVSEQTQTLCPGNMSATWIGAQSVIVNCPSRTLNKFIVVNRADVAITDGESADWIRFDRLALTAGDRPGPDFQWTEIGAFSVYDTYHMPPIPTVDYIASDFRSLRGNVRRVWLAREYLRARQDGTVRETVLIEVNCHQGDSRIIDFTDVTADGKVRSRSWRIDEEDRRRSDLYLTQPLENRHLDLICTAFEGTKVLPSPAP